MEGTWHVQTKEGKFRISVEKELSLDFETREMKHTGWKIKVGGNQNTKCVFLILPKETNEGKFDRLDSEVGCILDSPQKPSGAKTITMVKLAITFAKQVSPNLEYLVLQDSASFPCTLPNHKSYQVNSTEQELFFYQKSQQNRRFNATIMNDPEIQKMQNERRQRFSDPAQKPESFDFKNPYLQEILEPLFINSKTWLEFIEKIKELQSNEKKCVIIQPWFKDALAKILGATTFSGLWWKIEVSDENMTTQTILQKGGAITRKNKKKTNFPKIQTQIDPTDWYEMDQSSFQPSIKKIDLIENKDE